MEELCGHLAVTSSVAAFVVAGHCWKTWLSWLCCDYKCFICFIHHGVMWAFTWQGTLSTVLNIWFLCSMHSRDVTSYIKPQGGPSPASHTRSLTGSFQDKQASSANKRPEEPKVVELPVLSSILGNKEQFDNATLMGRWPLSHVRHRTVNFHILNQSPPLNFLILDT